MYSFSEFKNLFFSNSSNIILIRDERTHGTLKNMIFNHICTFNNLLHSAVICLSKIFSKLTNDQTEHLILCMKLKLNINEKKIVLHKT